MAVVASVQVPIGRERLDGDLSLPESPRGVVVFAHGSGSGRHSPRNRSVAQILQAAGLATLLADLLTFAEAEADREAAHLRFDIDLLARRLLALIDWTRGEASLQSLPIGLFGASTGAAAALVAAAAQPEHIAAVVSRGGRPDLAGPALPKVMAPTLLLVGSLDHEVLTLNRRASERMRCINVIDVVDGAGHLFEESGALAEVSARARAWFVRWMGGHEASWPRQSTASDLDQ